MIHCSVTYIEFVNIHSKDTLKGTCRPNDEVTMGTMRDIIELDEREMVVGRRQYVQFVIMQSPLRSFISLLANTNTIQCFM